MFLILFYFSSFIFIYACMLWRSVIKHISVSTEEAASVSSALKRHTSFCSFHMHTYSSLRDTQPSNRDSCILSLIHTFHPFQSRVPVVSQLDSRASTPVVLCCLWLWVCQHHKPSSNNIITSRDKGIPLLICLLIPLLSGRRRVQKDLFPLFPARIWALVWSQQTVIVTHNKMFCLIFTEFGRIKWT